MDTVVVERTALERAIVFVCSIVLWVTTVVIFVILSANTALRYASGSSLQWANEVPELLFPWLVMAGVVLAAEKGAHIATVFLVDSVSSGARRIIAVIAWTGVALLYAVLVRATWRMLEIVHDERSPILQVPGSVTYVCVLIGMVLIAALALLAAWRHGAARSSGAISTNRVRRLRRGEPTMSALILIVFLGAAALAVPIAHAILLAALAAAASNDRVPLDLLVQQMVAQVQSFPLIAIPFFMLTGSLMMGGKLGQAIVGVLTALVGRWHGGPAQVSVLSSTLFVASPARRWPMRRRSLADHAVAPPAGLPDGVLGGVAGVCRHDRHHHPAVDPDDPVRAVVQRLDRRAVLRRHPARADAVRGLHGRVLVGGQAAQPAARDGAG